MTLFYMFLEQDYKNINKGGYSFDNRFLKNVEIQSKAKILKLENNDEFISLFNDNINAISCVVGKNGVGKTTFLELLITNLLWGLEPHKLSEANLTLFFYIEEEGRYKFYLQSYRDQGKQWQIHLKEENSNTYNIQDIHREETPSRDYSGSWKRITKTPIEFNVIFHNLSPFDNIYTLLKKKLSESENQRKHYLNRFRYIGVNNIEKNRPKYEYFSTVNLITLFFDERFKKLLSELKYTFTSIEININKEGFINYYGDIIDVQMKDIVKYINDEIYKILDYLFFANEFNISNYFEIDIFKKLFFLGSFSLDYLKDNTEEFKNLFLSKFNLEDNLYQTLKEINIDDEFFNPNNKFYMSNKLNLLSFIKNISLEDLEGINNLGKKDFMEKNYEKKDEIVQILKNLKRFTNYNYFSFEIKLSKPQNNEPINYFQLSSGEKSYLTLFCNVVSMINELLSIQSTIVEYDNKKRTFLIIFDEVELHLHPEWQRKFIYFINDFFKTKLNFVKFQFLIATHSPFIVSDLDNSQIIYLGNRENKLKTFGGNIFDIFKRDFYLTNSIGAFSEKIIKELSECLYFIFVSKNAFEGNFFPLRDYIDQPYQNRDKKDIENIRLLKRLKLFFKYKRDKKKYFSVIVSNSFFNEYISNKNMFTNKVKKIILQIGDDVIKRHLEKLVVEIQQLEIN